MTIRVTIQNDEEGAHRPDATVVIVDKEDHSRIVQPPVTIPPRGAITFFLWHSVTALINEGDVPAPVEPPKPTLLAEEVSRITVPGARPQREYHAGTEPFPALPNV